LGALKAHLLAPHDAHHERDRKNNDEYDEKYFCDAGCACGDAAKAESCGNDRNDEKYERVIQHGMTPPVDMIRVTSLRE
jgi:hypothetical protein